MKFLSKLNCFSPNHKRRQLKERFQAIDIDRSGTVDKDELRFLLCQCTGALPTDQEVEALMPGPRISFDAFAKIHDKVCKVPFASLSKVLVDFQHLSGRIEDTVVKSPPDLLPEDLPPEATEEPSVLEEVVTPLPPDDLITPPRHHRHLDEDDDVEWRHQEDEVMDF